MPDEQKPMNEESNDDTQKSAEQITTDLSAIENAQASEPELSNQNQSSVSEKGISPDASRPWLNEPQKKDRKKMIIASIIAGVVVAILLGGWATYAFWYQNPGKVLGDAVYHALHAKTFSSSGTLTVKAENFSFDANFSSNGGYKEGVSATADVQFTSNNSDKYELKAEALQAASGDYYFKLSKLKTLYEAFLKQSLASLREEEYSEQNIAQSREFYDSVIKPIIVNLDGNWVKFGLDDLRKYSKDTADEYECTQKVITKLADEPDKLSEIGKLYEQNRFLVVDSILDARDGNVGYQIEYDNSVAKKFNQAFESTELYKELKACGKEEGFLFDSSNDKGNVDGEIDPGDATVRTLEVWIGQWDHKLKSMKLSMERGVGDKKVTTIVDSTYEFNGTIVVNTPSDYKRFDEVIPKMGDFTGGAELQTWTLDEQGASKQI